MGALHAMTHDTVTHDTMTHDLNDGTEGAI
jgi:hypothetical protein